MQQEYVLKVSGLQLAKEKKDNDFLSKEFAAAGQTIENGGEVRLDKEYSDASVETMHMIDNLEDLKKLQEKYSP